MDNKLILTAAAVLRQCLTIRYMEVTATRLPAVPEGGIVVGKHDLGEGVIGLTLVGRERPFRSTEVRSERLAVYYLVAR